MRDDFAGDAEVLFERLGLPTQYVGPVVDEALIFDQPGPTSSRREVGRLDGPMAVRNRVLRV
ncbi:MAG: hypothetical protein R2748_17105 [Bryobacterales bacterium]